MAGNTLNKSNHTHSCHNNPCAAWKDDCGNVCGGFQPELHGRTLRRGAAGSLQLNHSVVLVRPVLRWVGVDWGRITACCSGVKCAFVLLGSKGRAQIAGLSPLPQLLTTGPTQELFFLFKKYTFSWRGSSGVRSRWSRMAHLGNTVSLGGTHTFCQWPNKLMSKT